VNTLRTPAFAGESLLVITQVYPPDPAAVGQHLADLTEAMARRGWQVTVYTAARGYDDPSVRYAPRETRNGVTVRRLPLSSFGKSSIAVRLLAQSLFMIQAIMRSLFLRQPSVILVSTSPPFAGYGGAIVSWMRRVPLVWWVMDINPDQMVRSNRLAPSSLFARVFDWMNRRTLRRAEAVIVLDRFMRDTMLRKVAVPEKIRVIPPWAHDNVLAALPHESNPFRKARGLDGRFVVMYSGNAGYSSPLATLLAAAKQLENDPRILFMFIGGGVIKKQIDELVAREQPPNIRTLPYQPFSELRYSLSAADVHVVSIADEAVGVVHPCKIYGALAVGRPVIALAAHESHAADILNQAPVGWLVQHGDVDRLVTLLRSLPEVDPETLNAMGAAGQAAVAGVFARDAALDKVCGIIEACAGSPSSLH
jgi:colanic acid biosynthesis glycosyl transferase WcaI